MLLVNIFSQVAFGSGLHDLNLGMIQGGAWPSMVPEECVVEGGVGFLPNRSLAQVKQELTAAIESSPDEA